MPIAIRRVVTGHDANGRSVVSIDEIAKNVISTRAGQSSTVIWSHAETPVDNAEAGDGGLRNVKDCAGDGAIFRVVQYDPGVAPRNHRTETIDYATVLSGEIDMRLDDGVDVRLRAGDVLVQRGTIHDWINPGTVPCVIAFVLVAAKPVAAAGSSLRAVG
jgi:mannose-6-phosphate isomerase-like protein (cupin superfamily)